MAPNTLEVLHWLAATVRKLDKILIALSDGVQQADAIDCKRGVTLKLDDMIPRAPVDVHIVGSSLRADAPTFEPEMAKIEINTFSQNSEANAACTGTWLELPQQPCCADFVSIAGEASVEMDVRDEEIRLPSVTDLPEPQECKRDDSHSRLRPDAADFQPNGDHKQGHGQICKSQQQPLQDAHHSHHTTGCWVHLPSVGTWLHPHRISIQAGTSEHWSEKETGEYVMKLVAAFRTGGDNKAYKEFRDGVNYAFDKCPSSNKPWLHELLLRAKRTWEIQIREKHEQASSATNAGGLQQETRRDRSLHSCVGDGAETVVLDQMWQDEGRARWWYNGVVICYLCGQADCSDDAAACCERRRREILGVEDRPHRRRKRRK